MPVRTSIADRGRARGQTLVARLCSDLDEARLDRGLSYAALSRPLGLSGQQVSRICRGRSPDVTILRLAQLYALVGLELTARGYPAGAPLRDAGHLTLLGRLRAEVAPSLEWRTEVPFVLPGTAERFDGRAWDATIAGAGWTIGVEAETHVRDIQALERRIALKLRDSGLTSAILLLGKTRHHRTLLALAEPALQSAFPVSARAALRSLRLGEATKGSAIIVL